MNKNIEKQLAELIKISQGVSNMIQVVLDDISNNVTKNTEIDEKVTEIDTNVTEIEEKVTEIKESEPKTDEKVQEIKPTEEVEVDLKSLSYNDLRKLCKEKGISSKGTKAELIEKLSSSKNEPVVEPKEESKEVKPTKTPQLKEEEAPVEEPQPVVSNVNEDVKPSFKKPTLSDRVEKELEQYSDEEIKQLLDETGISSKGQRQALIAKVVDAVEKGQIEISDDEEYEEPVAEENQEVAVPIEEDPHVLSTEEGEELEQQYSDEELTDPMEVYNFKSTPERERAIMEVKDETHKAIVDLSESDLNETLASCYTPDEGVTNDLPRTEREELLENMQYRLIDDDGVSHDFSDPYILNGNPSCCGHFLEQVGDDLMCPVCGTSYSVE